MNTERERVEPNEPKGSPARESNETNGQPGSTSGVRPALEKEHEDDDGDATVGGVGKGY